MALERSPHTTTSMRKMLFFLGQKQPLTTLSVPTNQKKTLTCTPYIRSFAQDYSQFSFGCSLFVLIRETSVVMRYSDSIGIEYGVCFEFFFWDLSKQLIYIPPIFMTKKYNPYIYDYSRDIQRSSISPRLKRK